MKITLIAKILLALIFTIQVISKVSGKNDELYKKWGFEGPKLYALAAVESAVVIGLFSPYGHYVALVMLGILGGAIMTLFKFKEPPTRFIMPLLALVNIGIILYFKYIKGS